MTITNSSRKRTRRTRGRTRQLAGLTISSLAASVSTYAVFTYFARTLDAESLGKYALLSTAILLISQLMDAGQSSHLASDLRRTQDRDGMAELVSAHVKRRLPFTVLAMAAATAVGM